jgi:carbohydrate-selective porin OprB
MRDSPRVTRSRPTVRLKRGGTSRAPPAAMGHPSLSAPFEKGVRRRASDGLTRTVSKAGHHDGSLLFETNLATPSKWRVGESTGRLLVAAGDQLRSKRASKARSFTAVFDGLWGGTNREAARKGHSHCWEYLQRVTANVSGGRRRARSEQGNSY